LTGCGFAQGLLNTRQACLFDGTIPCALLSTTSLTEIALVTGNLTNSGAFYEDGTRNRIRRAGRLSRYHDGLVRCFVPDGELGVGVRVRVAAPGCAGGHHNVNIATPTDEDPGRDSCLWRCTPTLRERRNAPRAEKPWAVRQPEAGLSGAALRLA
jgi:hypothetical protein